MEFPPDDCILKPHTPAGHIPLNRNMRLFSKLLMHINPPGTAISWWGHAGSVMELCLLPTCTGIVPTTGALQPLWGISSITRSTQIRLMLAHMCSSEQLFSVSWQTSSRFSSSLCARNPNESRRLHTASLARQNLLLPSSLPHGTLMVIMIMDLAWLLLLQSFDSL